MATTLIHGEALAELRKMPDASVDAVTTDPPAGIEFMGKSWDRFVEREPNASGAQTTEWDESGGKDGSRPFARNATSRYRGKNKASLLPFQDFIAEAFAEVYRVLKPGGHALVWALPRTSHHTAMGLERAGFEIRDVVTHLFGSGFPKSHNISLAIDNQAGAERDVVGVRKSYRPKANAVRDPNGFQDRSSGAVTAPATEAARTWTGWGSALKPGAEFWILARKPFDGTLADNVLAHGTGGLNVDACRIGWATSADEAEAKTKNQHGDFESGPVVGRTVFSDDTRPRDNYNATGRWPANVTLDEEAADLLDAQTGTLKSGEHKAGAFMGVHGKSGIYSPRNGAPVPAREADTGGASRFYYCAKPSPAERNEGGIKNTHPTVKSIALMRWLCRLITPPGGTILDPFAGSGTTLIAAAIEGFDAIGIEREEEYIRIANARVLAHVAAHHQEQKQQMVQLDLFSPPKER